MQVILDVSTLASIQQAQAFLRYLESGAAQAADAQQPAPQSAVQPQAAPQPQPAPQPAVQPQAAPQPQATVTQMPVPDEVATLRERIQNACSHLSNRMDEVGGIIQSYGARRVSELNIDQLREVCARIEGMVSG